MRKTDVAQRQNNAMDIKKVLGLLIEGFERHNVPYAVIGGFAVGALGVPRSTMDLDFLISSGSAVVVDALMTSMGYKKVFSSENASQYVSPVPEMGEVDFLHAFRPISLKMLAAAETVPVFNAAVKVKVLKVEDIIGLKLQSIANNPERSNKDGADIEELIKLHPVNWRILKEYFELFSMEIRFAELRKKYGEK